MRRGLTLHISSSIVSTPSGLGGLTDVALRPVVLVREGSIRMETRALIRGQRFARLDLGVGNASPPRGSTHGPRVYWERAAAMCTKVNMSKAMDWEECACALAVFRTVLRVQY